MRRIIVPFALAAILILPAAAPRPAIRAGEIRSGHPDRARTRLGRGVSPPRRRVHRRVLADEFIVTYDNGVRADRTIELELAKTAQREHRIVDDGRIHREGIRQHGGGVVHACTWLVPIKGQRVQNDYRFTDVFVLRDGRWQCVSSQSTKIQNPQPQ